jgi:Zn ribbon nucleic-acid-binding protein
MKLWHIIKAFCTQCLLNSKNNGLDVPIDDCVKIGNTTLCGYHLRELENDFKKYHSKD